MVDTFSAEFDRLADQAAFVFVGTIIRRGASTVSTVRPDDSTAVVRVDETIRLPPGFSTLNGRDITVRLLQPLKPGQYIFLADPLAVGNGIAVQETAHLDAANQSNRDQLQAAFARGYESRILPRIIAASAVALGTVGAVRRLAREGQQDDDKVPWATALFEVQHVIKGDPGLNSVRLVGPQHATRRLPRTPALREGRHAVLILQPPPPDALRALPDSEQAGALFAADTLDIQPPETAAEIERIVRQTEGRQR